MWSRIHLIPLLTAEEDRDLVRRHYADQAREKELLGSTTSPYNSDRYAFGGSQGRPWRFGLMMMTDSYGRHLRLHRPVCQNRGLGGMRRGGHPKGCGRSCTYCMKKILTDILSVIRLVVILRLDGIVRKDDFLKHQHLVKADI